jgi:hypothetical protein
MNNEVGRRVQESYTNSQWEDLGTDAKILKRILKKEKCLSVVWIQLAQNMAQVWVLKQ